MGGRPGRWVAASILIVRPAQGQGGGRKDCIKRVRGALAPPVLSPEDGRSRKWWRGIISRLWEQPSVPPLLQGTDGGLSPPLASPLPGAGDIMEMCWWLTTYVMVRPLRSTPWCIG